MEAGLSRRVLKLLLSNACAQSRMMLKTLSAHFDIQRTSWKATPAYHPSRVSQFEYELPSTFRVRKAVAARRRVQVDPVSNGGGARSRQRGRGRHDELLVSRVPA